MKLPYEKLLGYGMSWARKTCGEVSLGFEPTEFCGFGEKGMNPQKKIDKNGWNSKKELLLQRRSYPMDV